MPIENEMIQSKLQSRAHNDNNHGRTIFTVTATAATAAKSAKETNNEINKTI